MIPPYLLKFIFHCIKNERNIADFVNFFLEENKKLARSNIRDQYLSSISQIKLISRKEGAKMTNTRDAIIESAILLFHTKGFSGTSIRDIAKKAGTNVSNISYYFGHKHGLLEACLTTYFEAYLEQVEEGYQGDNDCATERLKRVTHKILHYQCRNIHLTRLVLREISLDTQMVREIMSTYLVKEKYFLRKIFEDGIASKEFQSFSINYMIIQYKSLLTMPFLNAYYLAEVLQVFPNETYFAKKYYKELCHWIDEVVCTTNNERLPMVLT